MTACIDLRALAGEQFRVAHDPAYAAEHGERGRTDDPWLLTIPCRFGHIFPWGSNRLALSTNTHGGTGKMLASLPFVQVEQDAEDGYTLTFDSQHFDQVAQLAKPKLRRRLTPEQRHNQIERLASFRFSAASKAPKTSPESTEAD